MALSISAVEAFSIYKNADGSFCVATTNSSWEDGFAPFILANNIASLEEAEALKRRGCEW